MSGYRSEHRARMPQMRVRGRHYPTKCRLTVATRIASYDVILPGMQDGSASGRAENGAGRGQAFTSDETRHVFALWRFRNLVAHFAPFRSIGRNPTMIP